MLASASPRRLALLAQVGLAPEAVLPAALDESPRPGELPRSHCERLAREKALAAAGAHVLAADTVVAAGRRILPKAETAEQARACLALLSGRRHRAITAVALRLPDGRLRTRTVESVVALNRLTPAQVEAYLASDEWRGKAGGYALQGRAAAFIRFVSGSPSGVIGLPLFETCQLLRGAGLLP